MRDVRVRVNDREVRRLRHHPKVEARGQRDSAAVAQLAADFAPKLTGEGAASIHEELQADGSWHVSWDQEHDYMRFQELGTEKMAPNPFLRPAAHLLSRF